MDKKTIRDIDVAGKTVLVRVDFNVPMKDEGKVITDDNRIVAALPTINYLLEHNPKAVVLFSHLGKIKTEEDKAKNNMAVVAPRLAELLGRDVKFVDATRGPKLEEAVKNAENGQVILVQNTRYEPGETKNDPELGKYWASLGDVFVEDAFGSVHRAHASTVGIPTNLKPAVAGFLLEKEIAYIGKAVSNPDRPLVAILGGSKVSSKIGVIENLLGIADKIIIGGGMMYTFAAAKGHKIGSSLVEEDKIELAKKYIEKGGDKLVLPVDSVVNTAFANEGDIKVVGEDVPDGYMGLDIGPKSVENIKKALEGAKTVIWNGPMGVFEMSNFAKGTIEVCKALAALDGANTIIGGGDSAAAVKQLGFADKVSHISTGGGASLEYMEGKVLPGIAAVDDK
ncbi:MAG TPA: phosphoglycerate kinase [Kandleria vitulina]|jgi:phosphoglycerate kinase|uniref:phosphoglycerate kinase n=1 Tax=Kandleria vitulina TaxID=1630 RepID=UPI000E920A36|nr:phosphoglycerate kinase [Kandleria vitulina]HCY53207.1 phosphoglycerate kinase [Kandleria vitulina]